MTNQPNAFIVDKGDCVEANTGAILFSIQHLASQRREVDRIIPNYRVPFFIKDAVGIGRPELPVAYIAEKTMEWYRKQPEDSRIRQTFPNAETDYQLLCKAAEEKALYW